MEVINDKYTYAKAENLFWEVVGTFVDEFIGKNERGIRQYWFEVFHFSEDLVNNSAPVLHEQVVDESIAPQAHKLFKQRVEYYHARYRFDPTLERVVYKGKLRSMSPITRNPLEPDPGDMENLKAACKYAIMQATFMHTWVNEHQYEDIARCFTAVWGCVSETIKMVSSGRSKTIQYRRT